MSYPTLGRGPVVVLLEPRLRALSTRARTGVACVCVERVVPIFEAMTAEPDKESSSAVRDAVQLVRRSLEGSVEQAEWDAAKTAVNDSMPPHDEGYEVGSAVRMAWTVGSSVESLLAAAAPRSPHDGLDNASHAAEAIRSAWEAVARFDEREERGEDWANSEDEWQKSMLLSAENGESVIEPAATPRWLGWLQKEWGWEARQRS